MECSGIEVLIEKAEDLKMLTTYIDYITGAILNEAEMPRLVMGFNDMSVCDSFCSLCDAINKMRILASSVDKG